ncbi:MAG: sensor histidine kinase [Deltaproteobacteria bacterium]|nr:sensor histidine kinase [Deltaproteobacteria bacterium]
METNKSYSIRPAGRHILTIGRDLIQDKYAAIVELVKNAYDADSPDVSITFKASGDRNHYSIIIEDHGHGMSRDTVINKWLVPSTDDKLKRRKSLGGRTMQGRKGVGRYAASILGDDLLLETIADSEKTTVFVEWSSFEKAQYLDEVEILVESEKTDLPSGTRLMITGGGELLAEWDQRQLDKLRFELKKLMSPVSSVLSDDEAKDTFRIYLTLENFLEGQDDIIHEEVEPYPIFDLSDYMIAGKIGADGKGVLFYSMQKARNTTEEKIPFDFGAPTGCGELLFDIRVYDREKEAIESLIGRGLKDESGNYVGKLQARQLLNEYNGIGVYRNDFRIRPLGDAEFDWLRLNEQRVQNPSKKIGSNQAIGYIQIQSEELSGLIEKSARDGLRENTAFENLKRISAEVISELEVRRFAYRLKAGLSRPALKVERELERLFAFDELKQGIRTKLEKSGVGKKIVDEINRIISKEEEDKNRIAEDIRQAVAIYQGQATLGKIVYIILHEGRGPLHYFKSQISNLNYWCESFQKKRDMETLDKIIPIAEGIGKNADVFVKLFSRLNPLAAGKRSKRKPLPLRKTIEDIFEVFREEMKKSNITTKIDGPVDFRFLGWHQDIYAIFTNLIDNSVYWINEKRSPEREITVDLATDGNELQYIDYRDTGPGIEPHLIASEVIFEPQFSTKPNGTGLGLAIAGEAASRNGLELKAFESENGAYFRIQPAGENNG